MDLTAALVVNIALALAAFSAIVVLAGWAIRTGARERPALARADEAWYEDDSAAA
jgi:hypothetical protein